MKRSFKNINYGSYTQDPDVNDLPIEYKQRVFTEQIIIFLDDKKIERLKVSSIEWSLDNIRYKSNNWNTNFNDIPVDGDERLTEIWRLYRKSNIILLS